MVEAIAEDTFTTVRNAARERFAATGKSYADLSKTDLEALRDHIASAMGVAKLIDGTFKMNAHIKTVRRPSGWAALTCRSHYFRKREAVTFNGNGFIGFAGWADAENVKPILTGFMAWCDTLKPKGCEP